MSQLRFNMLLHEVGIDPGEVRLLRHQTGLPDRRTPFDLWRARIEDFEHYQSYQLIKEREKFRARYWASFVGLADGRTLFVGLYEVGDPEPVTQDRALAETGQFMPAGTFDYYAPRRSDQLFDLAGRLYVDWGGGPSGKRAWKQRADRQDKVVSELHRDLRVLPYPGHMQLMAPLSIIADAPSDWIAVLSAARGVYLLTCPRTGELYVGSAVGGQGFWGRWMNYEADGHGGNVAFITRERSDWTVSILQLAGSADTVDDILAMEALWKAKLASRTFGLNRN